jgi:hypothetical protein
VLRDLAYQEFLGLPLVAYFGILTSLCVLLTFLIGFFSRKGKRFLPFKWHPRFAKIAIMAAVIHAVLALANLL